MQPTCRDRVQALLNSRPSPEGLLVIEVTVARGGHDDIMAPACGTHTSCNALQGRQQHSCESTDTNHLRVFCDIRPDPH